MNDRNAGPPTGRLRPEQLRAIVRTWRGDVIKTRVIEYLEQLTRDADVAVLEDFAHAQERAAAGFEDGDPLRVSYTIRADLARQLAERIKRLDSASRMLGSGNPARAQREPQSGDERRDPAPVPRDPPG